MDAGLRIRGVPAGGGEDRAVAGLESVNTGRVWTVDQRGIFFADQAGKLGTLFFYEFATRRVRQEIATGGPILFGTPSLSVSPDGNWLLYARQDAAQSDLMMLSGAW